MSEKCPHRTSPSAVDVCYGFMDGPFVLFPILELSDLPTVVASLTKDMLIEQYFV